MSKKLNHSLAIGIFQIGILLSSVSEGFSQTTNYFTWNNSTNLWSTTTAWTPTGGPQSSSSTTNTNVAVFAATGAGNNTVLLGSDRTVYGLIFTNGANAYTFGSVSTAKQLDIMSGIGLQNVSGQNQVFSLSVANNGTGLWTNSAGSTTTFNNGLNLTTATSTASRTLTLGGAGTWNVASAIANGGTATAGVVTITSTGTTTFSGNNTYDGRTTMNAAGGTLTLSGDNSEAAGGVTLTAGTLNINNNNALGTGALSLAGTGATINNTSGSAVVNAGNQAWAWADGLAFGASGNNANNNLNLGTGVVTASSTRTIALAGNNTKLTMGAVNITSSSSGRTITANGVGNTLEMGGLTMSASATPVTVTLAGTANIGVTGAIVTGTTAGNGLTVTATGTTTLSGANTYTGLTTMNAAGGTLTLSGNNSAASGGVTLTAGTLNINNNNALGTGALSLAGTGATINNTSGSAVVNAGNQAWTWADGLAFGASGNNANNNLNLGTGVVTASSGRTINLAGNNTKLTIGAVKIENTSGRTITANNTGGTGNTLEMGGLTLSSIATAPVTATLAGTANINVTGAIVSGSINGNGLTVATTGTTTLSGNNTYTGTTDFTGSGTTIISGNNSAAVGNVKIAGETGKTPNVRLDTINAISSSSSLLGASGVAQIGTLDLRAAGNFSLNSFGTVSTAGNNMIFINSSGSQKTLGFTAANNYITAASTGGRTLYNNSANLLVDFDGNVEIGGTSAAAEATTFAGVGNFNVDGNLLDTGTGLTRILRKQGDGTLTLRGSANSIKGSTVVETGTLDLYGNITASADIVVSTSGTSANTGVRTANATVNVRSGASLLNSSTTTVWSRGDLIVNGTAGAVVVESNGLLGGSGIVGAISGSGTVGPGNSPGILTATSVNPTAGTDFKFEFTSLNPTYTSATASGNDLLHLTASSSPFAGGTFASGNIISIYLNSSAITDSLLAGTNTTFSGGFFVDGTYALSSALTPASFAYYTTSASLGTGSAVDYNGNSYYLMDGFATKVTLSDTLVTSAAFATGTVATGTLLTFTAVPEPSTGSLLAFGLGGLVVTRLLRRKQS